MRLPPQCVNANTPAGVCIPTGAIAAGPGQEGSWVPTMLPGCPELSDIGGDGGGLDLDFQPADWKHGEYVIAYNGGAPVKMQGTSYWIDGWAVVDPPLDLAAVRQNTNWYEPTVTAQDATNAAKLGPLGYVATPLTPWTSFQGISVAPAPIDPTQGGIAYDFHWNGTAWAPGNAP